ncbi:MAG TPA: DUF169 domain-containing protein [bacterium]|nr:DUF169 domain-containing protein [bacterium]
MRTYGDMAQKFIETIGLKNVPIGVYYADEKPAGALTHKGVGRGMCVVGLIYQASQGKSVAFDAETYGCPGAGRYLGFNFQTMPHFAEFLSCGIEGVVEGERYIKTPALARVKIGRQPLREAPARYCCFVPLPELPEGIEPELVIFFAPPDHLSALVILADFGNELEDSNVIIRFAAGCGQMVAEPLVEGAAERQRAILGMFDVSARPHVPANLLTLTVPTRMFTEMAGDIDESFLGTESWQKVRRRHE